ncbi:MAG: hypothetical protein U0183_12010 [Polyangiaceae bacterium]
MTGRELPLAIVVALVGCTVPRSAPGNAIADASAPDGAVAVAPPVDGGAAKTEPEIELLHAVPCVVAVSSKVDNPKDFPEHLVDGKLETAWNGKTGDLGGYIAFRTPKEARVRRISLTVGFDRGALFEKNHRIKKVRISREGRVLFERVLDPSARGFQDIALDEAGGDFKIDVLETAPGTEKTWNELVVSELRVFGLANGAKENPVHMPELAIGSLDGAPPRREPVPGKPAPGPFATVTELCLDYTKAMAKPIDSAFPGDRYPGKIAAPHCTLASDPPPSTAGEGSPFKSAKVVRIHDPAMERARLVLETDKGFSLTQVELWSRYHDDPGCGHASEHVFLGAKVEKGSRGRSVLVIRTLATDIYWLGATDPGGTVERAYACDVDASSVARCDGPVVLGRAIGWPGGWDPGRGTYPRVDPDKVSWTFRKRYSFGPAGDLRAGE